MRERRISIRARGLAMAAALAVGLSVPIGAGAAAASEGSGPARSTCSGTLAAPGVLSGVYRGDVTVTGVCDVDGGRALVRGDLTLAPGAVLNATFARNDVSGTGTSRLVAKDEIHVGQDAALLMGCEPNFSPCTDDPAAANGGSGTLTSRSHVFGDLDASGALAVIVHASHINGDVRQTGGGGGPSCAPPSTGIFSVIKSPVFSDYENNRIGGDLRVLDLQTCYFGALRNRVTDLTFSNNTMTDPDSSELLTNVVRGDIGCFHNSPAVQYGDSMGMPNRVAGDAGGECGFDVRQPNPSPGGPLAPISVQR